ncbi:hypothetical protein P692DRAFT_20879585 [Suillus brevipes Sb2]|nr:hypothetical protein P692DRAFT_20879585 [Suillus brevipes Sb2]
MSQALQITHFQSIAIYIYIQETTTNTESSSAKLPPKKSLPPRGPGSQFIKAVTHPELADLSASGESSPLNTPEISQHTLEQGIQTDLEYKVNQQLADNELEDTEDNELLLGAPEPNIIIPFPKSVKTMLNRWSGEAWLQLVRCALYPSTCP